MINIEFYTSARSIYLFVIAIQNGHRHTILDRLFFAVVSLLSGIFLFDFQSDTHLESIALFLIGSGFIETSLIYLNL